MLHEEKKLLIDYDKVNNLLEKEMKIGCTFYDMNDLFVGDDFYLQDHVVDYTVEINKEEIEN